MPVVFTEPDGRIRLIHFKPEQLPDEKRASGVELDEIPEPPEAGMGESAVAFLEDGAVVYKMMPRELTEEERIAQLEQKLAALLGE